MLSKGTEGKQPVLLVTQHVPETVSDTFSDYISTAAHNDDVTSQYDH